MKKQFLSKAFLVALGLGAVTVASAQTSTMRTNIPFSFVAGKTAMPAGDYRISVDAATRMLQLQPVARTATYSVFLLPVTEKRRGHDIDNGLLEFQKHGDTYFLGAVFIPDQSLGNKLPVPKTVDAEASASVFSIPIR